MSALNTWKYFNNHNVYASAHFIVGLEGEIYYAVPVDEVAYTSNSANSYSIGIECATVGSNDHYSDAEYVSMVQLGAYLCDLYGLDPRTDFIRHYDITEKVCPRYFVNNKSKWEQFKNDCYNYTMPNQFSILAPADFNGDDSITRDDVIWLLLYITMPDLFPLTPN